MSTYDRQILANSRRTIMARLDMPRLPFDCARCRFELRCATLAPSRPVVCELPDEACGVTLPNPRIGDWERCTEEFADYYLRVHVLTVPRANRAE